MIETYIILSACLVYFNYLLIRNCIEERKVEVIDFSTVKDLSCAICLEELNQVKYITKTSCNHYFCTNCILDWLKVKQNCPMCMQDLFS